MNKLGTIYHQHGQKIYISTKIGNTVAVANIHGHVHLDYNRGRRKAKAEALICFLHAC